MIDHKINSRGSGEPSAKKQRLEEARTVKKVILFNAVMFAFSRLAKFNSWLTLKRNLLPIDGASEERLSSHWRDRACYTLVNFIITAKLCKLCHIKHQGTVIID